jgi:hypothetical protein
VDDGSYDSDCFIYGSAFCFSGLVPVFLGVGGRCDWLFSAAWIYAYCNMKIF